MTRIVLFELHFTKGGEPRAVRLASGQTYDHPSAPGPYLDALLSYGRVVRRVYAGNLLFGRAEQDHGAIEVANTYGLYDWVAAPDCVPGDAAILVGSSEAAYGSFVRVFTGKVAQANPRADGTLEVLLRDTFGEVMDRELARTRFAGSNSAGAGLEGTEELADTPKPELLGRVFFAPAVCVNPGRSIYQVTHNRQIAAPSQVRVKGAVVATGQARTLAALQSTMPAAGTYDWSVGSAAEGAFIRLGSVPDGAVTVSATTAGTVSSRTPAQLWKQALTEFGEVPAGAISADDITALNAMAGYESGAWVGDTMRLGDLADLLAASAGAGYWQDPTGVWRIRAIRKPIGEPVFRLRRLDAVSNVGAEGDLDIGSVEALALNRTEGEAGAHTLRVQCGRNHARQDKGAIVQSAQADVERLSREWLEAASTDAALKAARPDLPVRQLPTALAARADGLSLGAALLPLLSPGTRFWSIGTFLDPASLADLDLCIPVTVDYPAPGLDGGRPGLLLGYELDLLTLDCDLTVVVFP